VTVMSTPVCFANLHPTWTHLYRHKCCISLIANVVFTSASTCSQLIRFLSYHRFRSEIRSSHQNLFLIQCVGLERFGGLSPQSIPKWAEFHYPFFPAKGVREYGIFWKNYGKNSNLVIWMEIWSQNEKIRKSAILLFCSILLDS
jgi:hypothetical protein